MTFCERINADISDFNSAISEDLGLKEGQLVYDTVSVQPTAIPFEEIQ